MHGTRNISSGGRCRLLIEILSIVKRVIVTLHTRSEDWFCRITRPEVLFGLFLAKSTSSIVNFLLILYLIEFIEGLEVPGVFEHHLELLIVIYGKRYIFIVLDEFIQFDIVMSVIFVH